MTDATPRGMGCVRHAFVEPLLRQGKAPTRMEVAATLEVGVGRVDAALAALEATHGVVLDPHSGEPWVLHPTRARRPQPGSRGIRKDGG